MDEVKRERSSEGLAARPGWAELLRASEDLHAAEILLGDPLIPARTVVAPLRECWRSLLAAARAAQLGASATIDDGALERGDPTAWLSEELPEVDAKTRAVLRRGWTSLAADPLVEADLRAHARDTRALIANLEPTIGGIPLRRRRRRRLWTSVGLAIVLLPVTIYTALNTTIDGDGPWRASYFPDRKLESTPIVVREETIDHDWDKDAPLDEIPPDKFSVRWDTCARVDEAGPVVFQLNANDGARLFVDGEVVIDAWERNTKTRKRGLGSAEVELEAGVHHLRVEYYESLGVASMTFAASFTGEPPAAVPAKRLIYPGDDLDEENLCGAVGAERADAGEPGGEPVAGSTGQAGTSGEG